MMLINWPVVDPRIPHLDFTPCPKEMHVRNRFLFVTNQPATPWSALLRLTLARWGNLSIHGEAETLNDDTLCHYDVIFVDAGHVADVGQFIACLRQRCEQQRIIVATASPTWKRAREAMQAGASDYIRKSSDATELHDIIQQALQNLPPTTPLA
jgi:DNA-binding NtrC family response regulator